MAESKNRYYRTFFIFETEDGGFGNGQEPSGYVKIESRDGKGTLQASVQNLKDAGSKILYKVYLMKAENGQLALIHAGNLTPARGRAELKWDFDAANVAMTGISVQNLNVAAVVAEQPERPGLTIQCPLAGYKGDKILWKEAARRQLQPPPLKKDEFVEEIFERKDTFSQYMDALKAEKPFGESAAAVKNQDLPSMDLPLGENELKPEKVVSPVELENQAPEGKIEPKAVQDKVSDKAPEQTLNEAADKAAEEKGEYPKYKSATDVLAEENPFSIQGNLGNCILKNNTFCGQEKAGEGYQTCMNCAAGNIKKESPKESKPAANVLERLGKSFEQYFTVFDPFNSGRRDYKWWKVNSPVYLNNLLYQCNVRTPLLFNPMVMMAHFKFRHLAIGIFSDRFKRREFIVCGIPGVFGVDTKPFGEMCKWVQIEGNTPRYGAFGYWVVYIDPGNGKFLNLT